MDRRDAGAPHQGHNAEMIEPVTELTHSMAVITQQVKFGSCKSRYATLYHCRYLHSGERETDDHARTIYQDSYKIFQLSFFMAGEFIIVEGVKEG